MLFDNPVEIVKGGFSADIALSVFEHADQADKIIIRRQIRLDVRKVAHMDRHVVTVLMAVSVDQTAFFRKVDAGYAARLLCEASRNRAAAGTDFQHLHAFVNRQPSDDIFPQVGKVVKHLPARRFIDFLGIFPGRDCFYQLQKRVLRRSVAVKILFRIMGIIQHNVPDLLCPACLHALNLLHLNLRFHIKIAHRILVGHDRNIQHVIKTMVHFKRIFFIPCHAQ